MELLNQCRPVFLEAKRGRAIYYLTSSSPQVQKDKAARRHLQLRNEADFKLRNLCITPEQVEHRDLGGSTSKC